MIIESFDRTFNLFKYFRTHYAVHYKTVFKTAPIKQFRCCPGFIRQPGYEGCVPGKHFPKKIILNYFIINIIE